MPAPKGHPPYNIGCEGVGRPVEWTKERIDKEAEALIEWSEKDDSIVFRAFAADRGYAPSWMTYLADKNEAFSEAIKIARARVATRRELGAIMGKFDNRIIQATMICYDPEYKAALIEMKRADKDAKEKDITVKIVNYKDLEGERD